MTDDVAREHVSTYLDMAIHEHNRDVGNLSVTNVDSACLTSSALRIHSFMKLRYRPLSPYTPPVDWLRMTGATRLMFANAMFLAKDNPDSVGCRMTSFTNQYREDRDNLRHLDEFQHLLRKQEPHGLAEPWDAEVCRAYQTALSCVGDIWRFRYHNVLPAGVARQLVIFPVLLDDKFFDLVAERRPRALVILAHYFAMLLVLRGLWYVGMTGVYEVHAIAEYLPREWRTMLREPLLLVENVDSFPDVMRGTPGKWPTADVIWP
ncbi:uncharacterized protein E0L32_011547 [Thyridium curvatum]|uniref:Uncharacterized protein n=1 Tax=Thyridium curvatum TaxID=1093900 RepID=A0A507BPQ6_9PEZI|nr:uncharacterized protein E0L32_011547 [Thyridium curvatum]TPX18798.1 hypothetical protein E0L32_011547 [Thyridium curvatum]